MDRKKAYRLIDANLNRAREGLRVIEDTLRFILEDVRLCRKTRSLRHRLTELTLELYPGMLEYRDSRADPGRTLKEGGRKDIPSLLAANFRRAEEALRVLEEYSKVMSPGLSPGFKSVRYGVYTCEKAVLKLGTAGRCHARKRSKR